MPNFKDLWLQYGALVAAALAVLFILGGREFRSLLSRVLQKWLGLQTLNIQVEQEKPVAAKGHLPGHDLGNPKCDRCQAEHERSLRHETDIMKLEGDIRDFKAVIFRKLDVQNACLVRIEINLAALAIEVKLRAPTKG